MKYTLEIELLEIEENNFHLLMKSTFKSGEIGVWIVDTGATKTVFDIGRIDFYEEIALDDDEFKSSGLTELVIETRLGEIKEINFGNFNLDKLQVALIDLDHINKMYSSFYQESICGLIGGDFLQKYHAIINYPKRKITLKK